MTTSQMIDYKPHIECGRGFDPRRLHQTLSTKSRAYDKLSSWFWLILVYTGTVYGKINGSIFRDSKIVRSVGSKAAKRFSKISHLAASILRRSPFLPPALSKAYPVILRRDLGVLL